MESNGKQTHQSAERDAKQAGLDHEIQEWLHTHAEREVIHEAKLDERLSEHRRHIERKGRQIDLVESIESERLQKLLTQRVTLESDLCAANEVAVKALAVLGLEYVPGQTSVQDVYAITKLHEADAADRAGLAGVHTSALGGSQILKWAGMVGCFVLATVGMGAVVMQTPPKQLAFNPIALLISMALASVIVAGVFLTVHPTWKRAGTMAASADRMKAKLGLTTAVVVSGACVLAVALIDAKAILAVNAALALVDPAHATPSWLAFLIGCCLSSVYVVGASVVAFNDAYALESTRRIEAEQRRHERAEMEDQRHYLEVRNAIESLNTVKSIERELDRLDPKIQEVQLALAGAIDRHHAETPESPDMPEEHKADLRTHRRHARFAGWKAQAQDATKRFRRADKENGL